MKKYTANGIQVDRFSGPWDNHKPYELSISAQVSKPSSFGPEGEKANETYQQAVQTLLAMEPEKIKEQATACENALLSFEQEQKAAACKWVDLASAALVADIADKILEGAGQEPSTTGNKWVIKPVRDGFETSISNRTFCATIRLEEGFSDKASFLVSYWVTPNAALCKRAILLSIHQKPFSSREKAEAYINGRKNFLTKKFFYEANPVIPRQYRSYFLAFGLEIPGYRYEKE